MNQMKVLLRRQSHPCATSVLLKRIRAAGGVAFVARDLRDVMRELNQLKGQTA